MKMVTLRSPPCSRRLLFSLKPFRPQSRRISTSQPPDADHEQLFQYTSGRWLWDADLRLRERYKRFNVSELEKVAARSTGAKSCVSITKFEEPGFNKDLRLVMDNGTSVIARIPTSANVPVFKNIASEVASMDFARTVLDIPAPKVLAWSCEAENPVESEYILMEEPTGTKFEEIWRDAELSDKIKIIESIVALEKKFVSVSLSRYGCIYFSDNAFPGCEKAEVIGAVSQAVKKDVENRFVIGPTVELSAWVGERASMDIDRGPWRKPQDYLRAIAHREIKCLHNYTGQKAPGGLFSNSEILRTPEYHVNIYKRYLNIIDYILPPGPRSKPILWNELRPGILHVSGTSITSFNDWQGSSIIPLSLAAESPLHRFATNHSLNILAQTDGLKGFEGDIEEKRIRANTDESVLLRAYELETKENNPIYHDVLQTPHLKERQQTAIFAHNTWEDGQNGILLLRQALIRVGRLWHEIHPGIPLPIHFTDEELDTNPALGQAFNAEANFWEGYQPFFHRLGWATHDGYDEAVDMLNVFKKICREEFTGDDLAAFEERTRKWPPPLAKKDG